MEKEKLPSTRIQWDIRIFWKARSNHWKYWIFNIKIFTFFYKRRLKEVKIYGEKNKKSS